MILYFSGTGNSEYVAKRLAKEVDDEVMNLFEKIRNRDFTSITSNAPWVIVTPTYAWRIPRIVYDWLKNTPLLKSNDIYFVMTCGGSIGNAKAYVTDLCTFKGLNLKGCFPIVMPENYIALYSAPDYKEALQIIEKAESSIAQTTMYIKQRKSCFKATITLKDKLNSGIVNTLFYPVFVHAKKFYVTDACVSCNTCQKVCPLQNIHMEKGKPVWSHHCTHCMACICKCPTKAIEYGKNSKHKIRYTCPK